MSEKPPSGRRVSKPRDPARRRRILDAAKRHFTQYGFKGTNLDAVASDAGCAKGALYLEFTDKEALLREVMAEVLAAIRARFEAEVAALESPHARLVATLRFAFHTLQTEPILARLLRDDPELQALRPHELAAEQGPAVRAQVDELGAWVDEGMARGEIREDIDRDAIPFVIGVLRFAPQHLSLGTGGLIPGDRVLAAIVDIFAAGLAARTSPRRGAPGRLK